MHRKAEIFGFFKSGECKIKICVCARTGGPHYPWLTETGKTPFKVDPL